MQPHDEQEIPGKLFDRVLMRRMLAFALPYRGPLAWSTLLILPLLLLSNVQPLAIKRLVDTVDGALRNGPPADLGWKLAQPCLFFVGVAVAAFVFRYVQSYLMSWIGQRVIFDLRAAIYEKILRLPLAYFDRNPVGRLMTRVSSDVDAIQRLLTDGLVGLVSDLTSLVGILGFMAWLSPRLTLTTFVILPLLLGSLMFINYHVRVAHRLVRMRQSAISAYLQEMITGMTTIQLFNREATAIRRYDDHNRGLRDAFLKSTYWFSFYFPSMELLSGLSIGLVLAVGTWLIVQAPPAEAQGAAAVLTAGGLVAFINYVRDFFRPLEGLSDKSNVFQSAMASAERVFQLLDEPETLQDPPQPAPLQKLRGEIAFDDVWFAYNDENWVLRGLSLAIKPGESVAIVGATGAGKSSIISLIARFYDVQKGAVKVDGVDVRAYAQADLRRRIGIVLQDPFMFAGKMADNIGLHNPDVPRDRIVEAAKRVNADGFITARPDGYDGEVLERGAGLSTGQKQLLALARAIAQDPDIVLILDEATANVDTETERLIQDALRKLMKGRTCIVIAHRLSTIRDADRIVCLRRGEIVEQGPHDELIARDGYYRRLYELLSHEAH